MMMRAALLLFLTTFALRVVLSEREERFAVGPSNIVRFENNVCTTLGGFDGTCFTRRQCRDINGTGLGSCATNNIGTCCLIQRSYCGGVSAFNNTYFVNPGYPSISSTNAGTCSFSIRQLDNNICQVRLDFISLTLAQPDGNGNCITDALVVAGGASNVPVICGENSGQHIYVNFNNNSDITISLFIGNINTVARSWNIKIAQLACGCPSLAPTGCLMYYSSSSDTVRSFNYGTTLNGATVQTTINGAFVTRPGTRQLANNNYGVCVQMLAGYCSIQWAQTAGDVFSFSVTGNTAVDEITGLPTNGIVGSQCTTDFVIIPNPTRQADGTVLGADRFCGDQLTTVISSSKPFVLTVVTDNNDLLDVANRGFSLTFTQLPCSGLTNIQTLINQG